MKIADRVSNEENVFKTHDYYLGRLLTILDASIPGAQGKAIKDLVRQEMYEYAQDILSNIHLSESRQQTSNGEPIKVIFKS